MMILPKFPMDTFVSLVGLIPKRNLLECAYISRMKKHQVTKLNKDFDTKRQKELAEEQTKDKEFFVNYNPLANSAFGAPGKLSEMPKLNRVQEGLVKITFITKSMRKWSLLV